jgi:hypothetical protein
MRYIKSRSIVAQSSDFLVRVVRRMPRPSSLPAPPHAKAGIPQPLTETEVEARARKWTSISQSKSRGKKKYVANHLRQFRVKTPAIINPASTNRALFLASRLRTESHQTSVGIKLAAIFCGRPGGICRPRETLVPSHVQGVACTLRGYRVFDDASPLVAHDLGDSVNCIH